MAAVGYDGFQLGYQPATKTGFQVAKLVRRQFGDESGVQIEDADIINWINTAQDTIVNRNRILKTRARTNSVVGQTEYQLPAFNILQIESLHYNGAVLPAKSFVQAELDSVGQADSGDPSYWYEWGGVFKLFPSPKSVAQIELYYSVGAAGVAQLSDVLTVPDKYFEAVVAYCLQMAYEMDEDMNVSAAKSQQFEGIVSGLGEEERTEQHMTYGRITIVEDA